ncbi:hypothetical protein NQZ79_g488 [Umbelopsis isabellina]|nr:hypothetical protein NQZ79_g488 [Umbelopsis isabellina]
MVEESSFNSNCTVNISVIKDRCTWDDWMGRYSSEPGVKSEFQKPWVGGGVSAMKATKRRFSYLASSL